MDEDNHHYGFGVERLINEENYDRFVQSFRTVASAKGIWKLYTGEGRANSALIPETEPASSWEGDQSRLGVQFALDLLLFWVSEEIKPQIAQFDTPQAAWAFLASKYNDSGQAEYTAILDRMTRTVLGNFRTVTQFIDAWKQLRARIAANGAAISDLQLWRFVIFCLPGEWLLDIGREYGLPPPCVRELCYGHATQKAPSLEELHAFLLTLERSWPPLKRNPQGCFVPDSMISDFTGLIKSAMLPHPILPSESGRSCFHARYQDLVEAKRALR